MKKLSEKARRRWEESETNKKQYVKPLGFSKIKNKANYLKYKIKDGRNDRILTYKLLPPRTCLFSVTRRNPQKSCPIFPRITMNKPRIHHTIGQPLVNVCYSS